MLSALPTTPAPTTPTPSTAAWLFLSGMLTCLLAAGHQWPATRTQAPAQQTAISQPALARPTPRAVAAPVADQQYVATRTLAAAL